MMDKERWKIQNRVYRMKDRKLKLENFIKQIEKDIQFIKNFNLFERDEDIKFRHYKAFYILKKAKKEIITLTKEIKYYEQY
jgi:hemin uptake protein HemP